MKLNLSLAISKGHWSVVEYCLDIFPWKFWLQYVEEKFFLEFPKLEDEKSHENIHLFFSLSTLRWLTINSIEDFIFLNIRTVMFGTEKEYFHSFNFD